MIMIEVLYPNKMYMTRKREHSLKISRQKHIEELISEFNQQLRISSTTQQNFSPQRTTNDRLPLIPQEKNRPRTDRFLSQRLKYQHNLHTVIVEIKNKLQATQRQAFSNSKTISAHSSPNKQLNQSDFRIKAINLNNLSPEKAKANLTRSYIEATQKKLAEERKKKQTRYQRFDFEPWGGLEQSQALQTITF